MKKLTRVVLALVCVAAAGRLAHAADNGTEFGIEDDLTVLGKEGTASDPDVEVKGFTVFGSTQAAYQIPVGSGNVVLNGTVQVSSGLYVAGASSFTSGAYHTGVSSFSDVANVHFAGGTADQVLKKVAGGGMVWGNDNNTTMSFQTPYRIQMVNGTDTDLADSLFLQNSGGSNITMLSASSMTILGDGTDGLGVSGATKLNGNTSILGANTFTVGTGLATLGGALNVVGDADLDARLNVDLAATFVSSVTAKGNAQFGDAVTDIHGVNMAPAADTALSVAGQSVSGDFAAKFYSGGSLAAWIKKK